MWIMFRATNQNYILLTDITLDLLIIVLKYDRRWESRLFFDDW
jgi:hypothetical protein